MEDRNIKEIQTCYVSKSTNCAKLATSMMLSIKQGMEVEAIAMGAISVYALNKALALLKIFALENGCKPLIFTPYFKAVQDKRDITCSAFCWHIKLEE